MIFFRENLQFIKSYTLKTVFLTNEIFFVQIDQKLRIFYGRTFSSKYGAFSRDIFARADVCEPHPQTRAIVHACIIRGACVYVHGVYVCARVWFVHV